MRITQRATRRRILSRVKPTTAAGRALLALPTTGEALLARMHALEDFVSAAYLGHSRHLEQILATVRDYAQQQDSLNSEVRRTMTAGPFSPDALSKMFQRMDNQMTVLKQTLDTLCRRGHIHAG